MIYGAEEPLPMKNGTCPLCQSRSFYVKNPQDSYEVHEFHLEQGKIVFEPEEDAGEAPDIEEGTETYCTRCSWHDKFRML
jgi:hypothetical protein